MATPTPTLRTIREQIDQIGAEYDARFAGQSRVTRDLSVLNDLVNRMKRAQQDLERIQRNVPATEFGQLRDTVRQSLQVYETERKEIMRVKSLGPDFEDFDALRTQANLTFAAYHRHFAGKARNTRDLGLLAELIDDLERVRDAMKELEPSIPAGHGTREDLDLVTQNIAMYTAERGEIVEARAMGTPEEQAGALAECANGQFKVYDTHFAGKSRLTRRPALLQRMIDNLTQIQDRMRTLRDQGLRTDYNDQNIQIVEESLGTYRTELEEIRKARQTTRFADLQGNLGGAANEIFKLYADNFAGQDRRTRSLQLLSDICDQLSEIGRQMWDLGRAEPSEMNDRNLQIVTEQRVMFEREYTAIEDALAGRTAAPTTTR
jgi:hypothetical protein